MYAIEDDIQRSETVRVGVSDPARSFEFYQDLFGLVMRETGSAGAQRLLETPSDQGGVSIMLTRRSAEDSGLWLSVEVATVGEVLDLYLLAIMMGAKASLPRKRASKWNTVIVDPDGNRISVWTRVNDEAEVVAPTRRPQRWRWELGARHHRNREGAGGAGCGSDQISTTTSPRASLFEEDGGGPGRSAAGADRVDRRCSARGAGTSSAPGRDPMLEGKE